MNTQLKLKSFAKLEQDKTLKRLQVNLTSFRQQVIMEERDKMVKSFKY